jgi:3-isopropylmalate/(R)-2-methylmalate dehydratase small subunit
MSALPAGPVTCVTGTAIVLRGHDVDTDRIMPARFLRAVSFEGLGDHVFEDDRAQAASAGHPHPFDDPSRTGAAILLVNRNFGCGSSREHAPQGLLRRGIRALVGESFSEIFFGNATALGLPCVSAEPDAVDRLMALAESDASVPLIVDLRTMRATAADAVATVRLPAAVRDAFLDGTWDATGALLEAFDQVKAVAGRLPYMTRW